MNRDVHNKILEKFGYPNSLLKEYKHWYWLLRPKQVTIGSSILITKKHYYNYSDLPKECFIEFEQVVKDTEEILFKDFEYKKINYLMLMMNDPSVHFHVIPRYAESIIFKKKEFKDVGYPDQPNLLFVNETNETEFNEIRNFIIEKEI